MSKKYYRTISLIEGVYLEKDKLIIQRDWSKYFDFSIRIWNTELLNENEDEKENERRIIWMLNKQSQWNKRIKDYAKGFVNDIKKAVAQYRSFYDVVDKNYIFRQDSSLNPSILSERKYLLQYPYDKVLIKDIRICVEKFKSSLPKKTIFEFDSDFKDDQCTISRNFNFETLFSHNEALFDVNNDFLKHQWLISKKIRTIFSKFRDTNWEIINSIENKIYSGEIPENDIYRISIEIPDDLGLGELNEDFIPKYDIVFFERGDYIIFKSLQ